MMWLRSFDAKNSLIVLIADGVSKTGSMVVDHLTRLGQIVYYGVDRATERSGMNPAAVPLDINLQDDSSIHAAVTKILPLQTSVGHLPILRRPYGIASKSILTGRWP